MRKRVLGLVILLIAVPVAVLLAWNYMQSPRTTDVAIYVGTGTWEDSVRASQEMFHWMNCTVELVDAEYINNVGLRAFRILCVPGGDMYAYAQDISSEGMENIRSFVRSGDGYIEICGGAYFAAEGII